jgi:hypothetical protein
MSVKLIITERQLKALKSYVNENIGHQHMVEKMVADLDQNYEPMLGVIREDGEYHDTPMVKIKIDESEITPKQLFEYLKKKYPVNDEFVKQVIQDWMYGNIKDNKLSKNVSFS